MQLLLQAARNREANNVEKLNCFLILVSFEFKSYFQSKKKELVSKKICGFTVYGYKYKTMQRLFNEIFLEKAYNFYFKNDNPVILDCGSNIGVAILFFKKKYPNSTIVGFEPNPFAFDALNKNMVVNKQDVTCLSCGLADEAKAIDFYLEEEGSLTGSIHEKRGENQKFEVNVVKLSDYITRYQPDLVKMDIEGAETLVLTDLVKTNTLYIPKEYIVEYHHPSQYHLKLASFLGHFEKAGFDYNLKTNYNKPGDCQDVLIHFYKKSLIQQL